jgi:hypothetical protein
MVYINTLITASLATAGLIGQTIAHPGEHHDHDEHKKALVTRDLHAAHLARGLAACANSKAIRDLHARAETRRFQKAEALRGLSSSKLYRHNTKAFD